MKSRPYSEECWYGSQRLAVSVCDGIKVSEAAKSFSVPKSTLQDHIKRSTQQLVLGVHEQEIRCQVRGFGMTKQLTET